MEEKFPSPPLQPNCPLLLLLLHPFQPLWLPLCSWKELKAFLSSVLSHSAPLTLPLLTSLFLFHLLVLSLNISSKSIVLLLLANLD